MHRNSQVVVVAEFVVSGIQFKRTLKFGLRTLQYLYVEVSWEECFGGDEPGFGRVRVGLQALPRSPHEPRLVRARHRVNLHSHRRHHDVNMPSQRQHVAKLSVAHTTWKITVRVPTTKIFIKFQKTVSAVTDTRFPGGGVNPGGGNLLLGMKMEKFN